jgi:hypothetical protein
MDFGTSRFTRMRIAAILLLTGFIADRLPNMTFCGPARDTVLTNRPTEKLNFDTNYITIHFISLTPHENTISAIFCRLVCFLSPSLANII